MVDMGVAKEDSVGGHFTFSFVETGDVGNDSQTD
jgi:hypothetical protein